MKTGTLAPVSNTATWQDEIEFLDNDTEEPIDMSLIDAITLKVRDPETKSTVLEASLDDGIEVVGDDGDGTIQFTFSADSMSALCPKTYEVGCLIEDEDGFVTQIILGHLPVLEGL